MAEAGIYGPDRPCARSYTRRDVFIVASTIARAMACLAILTFPGDTLPAVYTSPLPEQKRISGKCHPDDKERPQTKDNVHETRGASDEGEEE